MERLDGWPEHAMDVMARSWLGHHPLTDRPTRTHTHTHTCARVLLLHVSARVDRRRVVPIAITALMMTRGDILGDDHDPRLPRPLW